VLGDDALLARDTNANGLVDDGTELFGNRTTSGFAQLAALDGNADGKIDASDAAFASLRVWRDLDQDGVSDAGELQSLSAAGIAAISLNSTAAADGTEVRGNPVVRTAQFTRSDGTTSSVGDVTFNVSDMNTRWTGSGDASAAALALPQLGGLGREMRKSYAIHLGSRTRRRLRNPAKRIEPLTLSIIDAGRLLGLGRSTIYRLIGEDNSRL
jgi:hypothetical protein